MTQRPRADRVAARGLLERVMAWRHDTVQENALLGAAVGLLSGASFSIALGAGPAMVAFASALGFAAGFVIGILIWLETANLPGDRIPPVRRGVADDNQRPR